jgi:NitT/TauT family transport system permease protein
MKRRAMSLLHSIGILLVLLLLWQALISMTHAPPFMLPGPASVAAAAIRNLPALLHSLGITALAATGGLAGAVLIGILIALVFAQWRWLRQMLYPYTILLQTVPIVAIAPLILMWAGPGVLSVMLIAFLISLAPVIANTTQGLISVNETFIDLFLMHKATPAQILFKLRLPHAMPSLFTGIRIAAGTSVIGAITGELFAGSSRVGQGGLGYSIVYASAQLETDYLFALVLAATALGFAFYFIVNSLEWYFLHQWHESVLPAAE